MNKLRILLAEDHETIRDGLKLLVNSQSDMEVVGEADNGRVALDLAEQLLPDVVVMDISMPELNGLQATKKLKEKCPRVKVLILTRHADQYRGINPRLRRMRVPHPTCGIIKGGHWRTE